MSCFHPPAGPVNWLEAILVSIVGVQPPRVLDQHPGDGGRVPGAEPWAGGGEGGAGGGQRGG